MKTGNLKNIAATALIALVWLAAGSVPMAGAAELSAEELAKLAQNPIANLISVPFQNNANLNYGPLHRTQDMLNIQPVIPVELNSDWNLITRTIVPVLCQPALSNTTDSVNGVGDAQFSAFVSPAKAEGLIWGVGPIVQAPTHTNDALGNDRWGLGPTAVALHMEKGDPWVYGVLANNVWSVSDSSSPGSKAYSNLLVQPFLNYNLPGGTYLVSSPIITANWKADGEKWNVPIGGGIGHIFHFGRMPVNAQIAGYYNVVRPEFGSNWQIRAQVTFMFPK